MSYTAKGRIHHIGETINVSESFRRRDFVLELAEGQYTQHVQFQMIADRCDILDHCYIGQGVVVDFDLRGKEWNGKYITNLNAWRVTDPSKTNV
jgi:single-strand DNA-binding protein